MTDSSNQPSNQPNQSKMSAQNDSLNIPMASPVPVASPVVPRKKPTKLKPVAGAAEVVVEAVVEEKAEAVAPKAVKPRVKRSVPVVVEEEAVEEPSFMEENDVEVMIKQSEYKSLLARVEALESKKKSVRESAPRKSAVRIPTKDVILRDILRDGEQVYAKELVNDGERSGEYLTWRAVFSTKLNGFYIIDYEGEDSVENIVERNERTWGVKRAVATSPTTLCSRFRYLMKEAGMCKRGASTCCGFAKCYVSRDGVPMKLNTLW